MVGDLYGLTAKVGTQDYELCRNLELLCLKPGKVYTHILEASC